jgi:hypothetical protein
MWWVLCGGCVPSNTKTEDCVDERGCKMAVTKLGGVDYFVCVVLPTLVAIVLYLPSGIYCFDISHILSRSIT